MPIPRTPVHTQALRCAAAITVTVLLISGCGLVKDLSGNGRDSADGGGAGGEGGSAESGQSEGDSGALPISLPQTSLGEGAVLEIRSLEHAANDTTVLKFALTNDRDEPLDIYDAFTNDKSEAQTAGGVSLIDVGERQQYLPIRYEGDSDYGYGCYCTTYFEFEDEWEIPPGDTWEMWAGFPAMPDGLETVSVFTPITGAVHDIPIAPDGGDPPEPLPERHDEPEVLDLTGTRETLGDERRDESGDHVSVALSSDVLFDVDESELRPDAQAKLEEVATEIDSSGATEVTIDGHTDDTGDDDINEPLSQDRADAVEEHLSGLVESSDTTFTAQGHGSTDPLVDNDTDENRQRNRRVTIAFDKPEEPEPSSEDAVEQQAPKEGGYGEGELREKAVNEYVHSLTVRVDAVDRSSAGGLTNVRYTVLNSAPEESTVIVSELRHIFECGSLSDGRFNGVFPVDPATETSFPVVTRSGGDCLAPPGNGVTVPADEGLTLWSVSWLDPAVSEVDVHFTPSFHPVEKVPVI